MSRAPLECPMCGLWNPPEAQRCDCGFDFPSGRLLYSLVNPSERARLAEYQHPPMRAVNGIGVTMYGCKNKEALTGIDAENAVFGGLEPYSYQAIQWLVVFFLPVLPSGTYRVLRARGSNFLRGRYVLRKVDWDWKQIASHYAAGWWWLGVIVLLWLAGPA